jgi:2,3-bisphosphoglycerate-dependent phosphoglycerate mutase
MPTKMLNGLHERILAPISPDNWLEHIERSFTAPDYALPGGESLNDTRLRALSAIAEIQRDGHSLPAAVSHGNLIASLFHAVDPSFGFEGWRSLRNPDVFEVKLEGGVPSSFRRVS